MKEYYKVKYTIVAEVDVPEEAYEGMSWEEIQEHEKENYDLTVIGENVKSVGIHIFRMSETR